MQSIQKLPSGFQIGDEVSFKQYESDQASELGIVMSVRFTKEAVFYDIVSYKYAKVRRDVDASCVKDPKSVKP